MLLADRGHAALVLGEAREADGRVALHLPALVVRRGEQRLDQLRARGGTSAGARAERAAGGERCGGVRGRESSLLCSQVQCARRDAGSAQAEEGSRASRLCSLAGRDVGQGRAAHLRLRGEHFEAAAVERELGGGERGIPADVARAVREQPAGELRVCVLCCGRV